MPSGWKGLHKGPQETLGQWGLRLAWRAASSPFRFAWNQTAGRGLDYLRWRSIANRAQAPIAWSERIEGLGKVGPEGQAQESPSGEGQAKDKEGWWTELRKSVYEGNLAMASSQVQWDLHNIAGHLGALNQNRGRGISPPDEEQLGPLKKLAEMKAALHFALARKKGASFFEAYRQARDISKSQPDFSVEDSLLAPPNYGETELERKQRLEHLEKHVVEPAWQRFNDYHADLLTDVVRLHRELYRGRENELVSLMGIGVGNLSKAMSKTKAELERLRGLSKAADGKSELVKDKAEMDRKIPLLERGYAKLEGLSNNADRSADRMVSKFNSMLRKTLQEARENREKWLAQEDKANEKRRRMMAKAEERYQAQFEGEPPADRPRRSKKRAEEEPRRKKRRPFSEGERDALLAAKLKRKVAEINKEVGVEEPPAAPDYSI